MLLCVIVQVGVLAEPSGRGYQLVVVDGTGMGIPEPWRVVRLRSLVVYTSRMSVLCVSTACASTW
jgi:hypothetical protein